MSEYSTSQFDPNKCASLHNELVQRLKEANPSIQPLQGVLITHRVDDSLRRRLSPDVRTFLSAIESWPVEGDVTALTSFCQPPRAQSLFQYRSWPQFSVYEDKLILLYQDVSLTMEKEGGLFFDQERKVACWIDPSLGFPPEDSWLPLGDILSRWLMMWDAGKMRVEPELSLQPWGQWDLQQSLNAWHELVAAIEERMPVQPEQKSGTTALVDTVAAERWCDHPFQHAFLTQAHAPKKPTMNIAPGVKPWTSSTFEAVHANEPVNSERRLAIGNKPSDDPQRECHRDRNLAPVLLFPSDTTVARPASHRFDNFWGRGSVLLERRAGLYLYPEEEWGDSVLYVDGRRRDMLFTYQNRWCPWMGERPLATLREVLTFWKFLVVDGVWQVDAHGVVGGEGYFDELDGSRKVVELGGTQTEVDLRAPWSAAPAY